VADELKHLTVGTILSQAEYEAIGGHVFDSQAQGDILYASSTTQLSRLGKDANATRALTNTGTNNNPVWAQIDLTNGVTDTLPVANGGTGATTLTDKAVLISQDSGTDTLGSVALTTSGQVIIGGSSGPAAATLTAGSNVTITNGDGSISIAASGGIDSLADDTTPQVGGSAGLDLQAQLLVGNGGTTGIAISANGEVTMAAQPAVFANAPTDNNETGNGSTHTIIWSTEIYDRNADFDGASTFTAPVTGIYHIAVLCYLVGVTTAGVRANLNIVASNRTINLAFGAGIMRDGDGGIAYNAAIDMDMDTSDTLTIGIRVQNESSDVVDINANSHLSVRLAA